MSKPFGDDDTLAATSGSGTGEIGTLAAGAKIGGRYEIVGFLGKGGMGTVYLAADEALDGKRVALKRISTTGIDTLRREVLLAQKVTHPNVCRIYDLEQVDGQWMIKMEYVAGETLAAKIARGPIPLHEALAIARRIADGLGAAHAQGVVHRDLKPGNVMIEDGGRVVLMDFGIARVATVSEETAPEIAGTPAYMAPEQVRAERVDARTDLYALGCVLYEMLTGEIPFPAPSAMAMGLRHVNDPAPSPREVPGWAAQAVTTLLAKSPDRRPRDVAAAERLLAGPQPRSFKLPIAIGGTVIAVGTLAFVLWPSPHHEWKPALKLLPSFDENSDWPVFSPDGTKIAFSSDRERSGWYRIHVMNADGSDDHAITPPDMNAGDAAWSRDGSALVFEEVGKSRSFRIPASGGTPEPLISAPGWSTSCGDGTIRLETQSPGCDSCNRILLVSAAGEEREVVRLAPGVDAVYPRCDRAGAHAVYAAKAGVGVTIYPPDDLWLVDLASGAQVRLTDDGARNLAASFTPDGEDIIYSSARGGDGRINLWEMRADGSHPIQLTTGEGNDIGGDASSDGTTFVYDVDATTVTLLAHPLDGGAARRLVPSRPLLAGLTIVPDGSEVIATDFAPLAPQIVAIDVRDGAMRTIAPGPAAAATPDGGEIVVADDARLAAYPRAGGDPRAIADLPGAILAVTVSGDGRVHVSVDHAGTYEAWSVPLRGGTETRDAGAGWSRVIPNPADGPDLWLGADGATIALAPHGQPPTDASPRIPAVLYAQPSFDAAGKSVIYFDGDSIDRYDLATATSTTLIENGADGGSALSPDGKTLYTAETVGRVQRVLISNFADRPRP